MQMPKYDYIIHAVLYGFARLFEFTKFHRHVATFF